MSMSPNCVLISLVTAGPEMSGHVTRNTVYFLVNRSLEFIWWLMQTIATIAFLVMQDNLITIPHLQA